MPGDLGIVDLLELFGFDASLKTKLIRHQDGRYDIPTLIQDGWFELYQSLQAKRCLSKCDQIVSFAGDGGTRSRFLGVYRVLGETPVSETTIPHNCPFPEWGPQSTYHYALERQPEYASLEGRVVVDWGPGALSWHQHLRNKPVIEIRPKGRALESFTDYLDFTLTFSQLRSLIANKEAHRDWFSSLSAVAGIYLILDPKTGQQYVGSAYGLEGIWGRWAQYAASGHGGNTMLRELMACDAAYPEAFRYSVLQVLPKTRSKTEVIRWENQYKAKLGSRATGLNQSEGKRTTS
jgi:hypothetical protein